MDANVKEIGNNLYNGALVTGALLATRMASTALGFKERPLELKPKSFAMFAAEATAATYIVKKAKEMGLPDKIFT